MNRLQAEQQRLYPAAPEGRTQVLVLQVAGPGAWDALGRAWQGVQVDLQWPAPGIAVAGEGYQLWFSLAQAVPVLEAARVLSSLKQRYLADAPAHRIALFPGDATSLPPLPPRPVGPDRWSAFVTPDLAALFADETWLDLPPNPEAQADLLSRLSPVGAAEWQQALRQQEAAPAPAVESSTSSARQDDPREFLLDVMNDRSVELALRIEAAKALLPYSGR